MFVFSLWHKVKMQRLYLSEYTVKTINKKIMHAKSILLFYKDIPVASTKYAEYQKQSWIIIKNGWKKRKKEKKG